MTLRGLATELYDAMRRVELLEERFHRVPAAGPERAALEDELRRARALRDRLRALLEGAKDR